MQAKYPAANLAVYFAFIEMCLQFEPEPKKGMTHEHHICPRKQFPEYVEEPENLITLYTPLHMHAHRLLGSAVPELSRASAAWIAAAARAGRKGGRKGGRTQGRKNKENGTGICAPGMSAKGGLKGGRIAGRKCKENSTGAFAPGMQAKGGIKGARTANHLRWHVKRGIVNPNCSLCQRATSPE
jgi:hypothetical protein